MAAVHQDAQQELQDRLQESQFHAAMSALTLLRCALQIVCALHCSLHALGLQSADLQALRCRCSRAAFRT